MDNGDGSASPDLVLLYERLTALRTVSMLSGTKAKRFTRQVCDMPLEKITARQRAYVEILCWTFRRQLPPHLVPASKPPALPNP